MITGSRRAWATVVRHRLACASYKHRRGAVKVLPENENVQDSAVLRADVELRSPRPLPAPRSTSSRSSAAARSRCPTSSWNSSTGRALPTTCGPRPLQPARSHRDRPRDRGGAGDAAARRYRPSRREAVQRADRPRRHREADGLRHRQDRRLRRGDGDGPAAAEHLLRRAGSLGGQGRAPFRPLRPRASALSVPLRHAAVPRRLRRAVLPAPQPGARPHGPAAERGAFADRPDLDVCAKTQASGRKTRRPARRSCCGRRAEIASGIQEEELLSEPPKLGPWVKGEHHPDSPGPGRRTTRRPAKRPPSSCTSQTTRSTANTSEKR